MRRTGDGADRTRISGTSAAVVLDDRIRRVAQALLERPADDRGLDEWGRVVGASARTLARLFREETSMTFGDWRTLARLDAALALLASGRPVTVAANLVGYTSASAFVAAFRRHLGTTPGAHFPAPGSTRQTGAGAVKRLARTAGAGSALRGRGQPAATTSLTSVRSTSPRSGAGRS